MNVDLTNTQAALPGILIVRELAWKGLALLRAARLQQPYWFTALLVLNTAGIFPIPYLLLTSAKGTKPALWHRLQGA